MDTEIDFGDVKLWRFTRVYASTDSREQHLMWSLISNFMASPTIPWVILGDFNSIISNEKSSGIDRNVWEMRNFNNFIRNNWLIDIGYVGYPFTWNNKRDGAANIQLRLDRALVNPLWRLAYPFGFFYNISSQGVRPMPHFTISYRDCSFSASIYFLC